MLTGVHFLLTYKCTYECDHCFLYCSPSSEGTFTLNRIDAALRQMKEIKSVTSAYFEGGEPFLFYPLILESVRLAKRMGFEVGIVTNGYWATSEEDALLWLKPLADIGIDDLSISDDSFHNGIEKDSPSQRALHAAKRLKIPTGSIRIEPPKVSQSRKWGGQPVVGGDVLFKGRAVDKLIGDLPRRSYSGFNECPHEELKDPGRVHLDPYGNVHVCQGIVIGNIFEKPLRDIIGDYRPDSDPIVGPLLHGGPAELARAFHYGTSSGFVDHCHLCFEVRRSILKQYPEILTPAQVYGICEET